MPVKLDLLREYCSWLHIIPVTREVLTIRHTLVDFLLCPFSKCTTQLRQALVEVDFVSQYWVAVLLKAARYINP